jgi:hypothetical protein
MHEGEGEGREFSNVLTPRVGRVSHITSADLTRVVTQNNSSERTL